MQKRRLMYLVKILDRLPIHRIHLQRHPAHQQPQAMVYQE